MPETITWEDFEKVHLRMGTVVEAREFSEARQPAWILLVDLGEMGIRKSSAQVTDRYTADELVGSQVLCVTNFAPKQIGPVRSEVLVTGFVTDGGVVLARPDAPVPNGTRLA